MFQKNNSWISKIIEWFLKFPKSISNTKISHKTGTKFLSLSLAILFWFFVMDQVDPEITRVFENIPVQFTNTQELDQNNLKIMNQTDFLVNVEVTGRRNNVLSLNSKAIYLWADMRAVRNGINNVYINRTINSESVSIKAVLPNEIILTIDRVVSLPKPVQISISDEFQESLFQEGLVVNPIEVKVTGPESLVNAVSYVGGTISVNSLTSDFTREVSLLPYAFDGEVVNGVNLDVSYASIDLKVGKTKQSSVNTEVLGEPMTGYKIVSVKMTPEMVSLSGKIDLIENIDTVFTEPIQLNGDENATFIVEKSLVLPEGVKANGLESGIQIELTIEKIQTKEFVFNITEIPVLNLDDKFKTDLSNILTPITVKITDVESIISNATKNDIYLEINFVNVNAAGIYRLKINTSKNNIFNEITIDPVYVDVTVLDSAAAPQIP